MSDQHDGDAILHQDEVEEVIDAEVTEVIEDNIEDLSSQGVIANLAAPSATYQEAEALASRDKLNLVLQVLRDMGAIPSA